MNRWQAHQAPDPTLPPDDVRQDLGMVASAILILVVIAVVAWLLNPVA